MMGKRASGGILVPLVAVFLFGTFALAAPARPKAAVKPKIAPRKVKQEASQVSFLSPQSGATLRGTTMLSVAKSGSKGYVTFNIDDHFAYSTTAPFEMRWDTSTATDGAHTLQAQAYDETGAPVGTTSVRVMVANRVALKGPIKLAIRFHREEILNRRVTANGDLGELALDEVLPPGLDSLSGRLTANLSQIVLDTSYKGFNTLLRNRIRKGGLLTGNTEKELSDLGVFATVEVSRNGLTLPVSAGADNRVSLGEISFALPDFPVKEGDTWDSPLGVVADLIKQDTVYVKAHHTFEGVWWYQGRECAKITSTYSIPDVSLPVQANFVSASLPTERELQPTQMGMPSAFPGAGGGGGGGQMGPGGMGGGNVGMGSGNMQGNYIDRDAMKLQREQLFKSIRRKRVRPLYSRAQMKERMKRLGLTGENGAGTSLQSVESAMLTELAGTRTTWLAIGSGKILASEDRIKGRLQFTLKPITTQTAGYVSGMPSMPGSGMPGAGGSGMGMPGGAMGGPGMGRMGMPGAGMPGMPGAGAGGGGAGMPGMPGAGGPGMGMMGMPGAGMPGMGQGAAGFPGMAGPPGATGTPTEKQKKVPSSISYNLRLVSELLAVK